MHYVLFHNVSELCFADLVCFHYSLYKEPFFFYSHDNQDQLVKIAKVKFVKLTPLSVSICGYEHISAYYC